MSTYKQPSLAELSVGGIQAEHHNYAAAPALWYTLVLAFLVRAVLSVHSRSHWFNTDTADYLRMADAIRAHHPYSFFPNGYPLLIAACESILPSSIVPATLIFVNVLLGTAIVAMVYCFTLRLTNNRGAALAAALVTAVYPNQLDYTFQLLTETSSAFLLSLGIMFLVFQRPLAAGWWIYLASTFRSSLSLVGPLLLVVGLIFHRPKGEMAKLAGGIALGWLIFFALEKSHIIEPASNLNANLLISIYGDSRHLNFSYNGAPEEVLKSAPKTYINFIYAHPKEFARQRAISLLELWGPPFSTVDGASASKPHSGTISLLLIGLRVPLFLLALWGGWTRRREYLTWIFLSPILLITIIHTLTFSTHRFSYPVEPLAITLAATGVFDWKHKRKKANKLKTIQSEMPKVNPK